MKCKIDSNCYFIFLPLIEQVKRQPMYFKLNFSYSQ